MNTLRRLLRKLACYIMDRTHPPKHDIVNMLIARTSSLELAKGEHMELAPVTGCCGPFRLSGNALPVFEYTVFEKSIMEFIKVRVEVSLPDKIFFQSTIDARQAKGIFISDNPDSIKFDERHGEEVETKEKYKQPFNQLILHLHRYFPFYRRKA